MTDLARLYRIDFEVEEPTDDHVQDGLSHVYLTIRPACHQFTDTSRYPYAEILRAWRWHAGVVARVGVELLFHVDAARAAHGCLDRYDERTQCLELHTDPGWLLEPDRLLKPTPWTLKDRQPEWRQDYPYLDLVIPGEAKRLAWWCRTVCETVEKAIASDLRPPPEPRPLHPGGVELSKTAAEQEQHR